MQNIPKRLTNEIKELGKSKNRIAEIQGYPDPTNLFTIYFMIRGDKNSDYKGGYYIGKIMLPEDYPNKAGDFMMLTPNGRFDINKKICLTNSGYHSESWTPLWTIVNTMLGFVSIFNADVDHGISHIKDTPENRRRMAKESVDFNKAKYPDIFVNFTQFVNPDGTLKTDEEISEFMKKKKKNKEETNDVIKEETKNKEDNNVSQMIDNVEKNIKELQDEIKNEPKNEEPKDNIQKIKENIKEISQMTYDNHNMQKFYDTYNLMTNKLSAL